jgi:hypothetical protein
LIAAAGVAVGFASLVYGSVVIVVGVVVLMLLARGWRGVLHAGVFTAAFAALPVGWIVVCKAVVGSYYNHEVEQWHEFVWLPQAAMKGWDPFIGGVTNNAVAAVREVVSMGWLPLVLAGCLAVVSVVLGVRLEPTSAEDRAILIGTAVTVVVSVLMTWGIGFIANRLAFPAVPGLLVAVGWLAARLSARSRVTRLATNVALSLVALTVVAVTVTAEGPYV